MTVGTKHNFVYDTRHVQFHMFNSMLQNYGYRVIFNNIILIDFANIPRYYIRITCFNCLDNCLSYKKRYILTSKLIQNGKEVILHESICSLCVEKVLLVSDL